MTTEYNAFLMKKKKPILGTLKREDTSAFKRAKGLLRVTALLAKAYTKQQVAQIIINEGFKVLGAHSGDISLIQDRHGYELIAKKGYSDDFFKNLPERAKNAPLITNYVIRTKKPYLIPNVEQLDTKYQIARHFITSTGAQAAALLPLKIKSKVIGIMQFTFKSVQDYNEADIVFMNTLANQCAQAFERVIALENLQESKKQLEIILQNTADAIIVQNVEGSIIYCNTVGRDFLGDYTATMTFVTILFKKYTIFDQHYKQLTPADFLENQIASENHSESTLLQFINKKTNQVLWMQMRSTVIHDAQSAVKLIVNTLHDITEVKLLDQRKDDFISMASHELKTPLTSLMLYAEMLVRELSRPGTKKNIEYSQRVVEHSKRLRNLVDGLLDVSRIQKGKLQFSYSEFRFDELVEHVVLELQQIYPEFLILLKKSEPILVNGDQLRIYQVITNLIQNAIKYSLGKKEIDVQFERKGKNVLVRITDFGMGISKEHQERIFERFYQIPKGRNEGLGMGLFISSEIIKHHGGKIWVTSNENEGSTFYFTLPIVTN